MREPLSVMEVLSYLWISFPIKELPFITDEFSLQEYVKSNLAISVYWLTVLFSYNASLILMIG